MLVETGAGQVSEKAAQQLTPELINHLLNAGAYSRTIDRLFDGFYGKAYTAAELIKMSAKEIDNVISLRYG